MALMSKAASGGGGFEPIPEGTHLARCVTVVDLGLQETEWGGKISFKHKVYVAFEVPAVRVKWTDKDDVEHEGAALAGQMYTNSIYEKANLGKHLIGWRGRAFSKEEEKGFDLFTILDKPCQISIAHNQSGDKTYANISGIVGLPPGVEVPARETDILAYTPSDPEKAKNFDKLPDWMKNKIGEAVEEKDVEPEPPEADTFDDDIPF